MMTNPIESQRRNFLRWLAGSTLAGSAAIVSGQSFAQDTVTSPYRITDPKDAINIFDLKTIAETSMRPAHRGYLETGVLDGATIASNSAAYSRWGIHARRLVDVSKIDLSTTLLGEKWASPIALAPVSSQRAFHSDGERPAAQAARARDALQILSTLSTVSIETVLRDRQRPIWFQLYPTNDRDTARALVERADKAGASAIVLTIDLIAGGMRREGQAILVRSDGGNCAQCHEPNGGFAAYVKRKPLFDRMDMTRLRSIGDPTLTWDFISRLREWTLKPVLVKGVMTPEDAELAIAAGVDGLVVSNHGGRAEESLIGTLDALPAIAAKVNRRIPILMDGGIRRGTDAFKALALGADVVCIGRPYIWGLASYGRDGIETAMRLLDQELRSAMAQAGVTRISQISRDRITRIS